ncbi:MAG TPA: MBG domain-containing protein [Puia sp.]|nr:MBG domain-containing protein [Puia sp.]
MTAFCAGLSTMLFAQPGFNFSPPTLPHGLYGSAYAKQTITVTGGKAPYKFSISSGKLPPGITLSSDGVISGTPSVAGTYSFTIEADGKAHGHDPQSGSKNYMLTVDPAAVTITANNASMPYGGPVPMLSVSFTGFVNGDNASSLTTQPAVTTTATASSPAGAYPITASGAKDPNYSFTYKPGTLTISQPPPVNHPTVHVTANAQTKEYGAADPTFTYTVSGLPAGDSTGIFTGGLSRAPGENVGTYPITIGTLSAGGKYTISYTGNNLTITKASQQITWSQSLAVGCNNKSQVQLNATTSSGLPVTYSVSDTSIATVSGSQLTLLKPGTAVVTAAQSGSANYNAAAVVADTALYQPASLITEHWNDVIFFDNSSGDYVAWQWYKNDSLIAGANNAYYSEEPSLNGQYFVVATNKDGQQVQSCTLTATGGAAIAGSIKVSPNPTSKGGVVTVVCNYSASALQGAVLQIADIGGVVVQQITNVQQSMQITLPSANGIYIVNLLLADGQRVTTNVLIR